MNGKSFIASVFCSVDDKVDESIYNSSYDLVLDSIGNETRDSVYLLVRSAVRIVVSDVVHESAFYSVHNQPKNQKVLESLL
jgi:hypothetical protein